MSHTTITKPTKSSYEKKARNLFLLFRKQTGLEVNSSSIDAFVDFFIQTHESGQYKASTWRFHRSAVKYVIEDMRINNQTVTDAIDRLSQHELQNKLSYKEKIANPKSSAKKHKKVNPADFDTLIEYIDDRYIGETLKLFLLANIEVGLRPVEWYDSTIISIGNNTLLKVKNAKATNGRGNGTYRHLYLDDLQPAQIENMQRLIDRMKIGGIDSSGVPVLEKQLISKIKHVTRQIWPRRKKHITLYSTRQQFAANAKKQAIEKVKNGEMTRTEGMKWVAAMFGHCVTDTVFKHYARARDGNRYCNIKPLDSEVQTVTLSKTSIRDLEYLSRFNKSNDDDELENQPTPIMDN